MSRTCLIADGSTMVRRVAARIVREMGFDILEAKTGRETVDACTDQSPDVVLLDWRFPDMDALDVIAQVKAAAKAPAPVLIFCTAERDVTRIVEALRAGADEYIMKPFDSDIIRAKFALAGLHDLQDASCAAA